MTSEVQVVRGHRWASATLATAIMVAWFWQGGSRVGILIGAVLTAVALLWFRHRAAKRPATIALAVFCILAFIALVEHGLTVGTRGGRIFSTTDASLPWFVNVAAMGLVGIAGSIFLCLATRGPKATIAGVAGVAYLGFSLVAHVPGMDQTWATVASGAAFFASVALAVLALRLDFGTPPERHASAREVDLSP